MGMAKYQAFFHDGSLQAVKHINDKIIFTLFSAEVDEKPAYSGYPHYHSLNPNSKTRHDKYFDVKGRPVRNGSEPSHLYHPNQVWWE